MKSKPGIGIILMPVIIIICQLVNDTTPLGILVMEGERDALHDANNNFIFQIMTSFASRLLDPCELLRRFHSSKPETDTASTNRRGGRITVRSTITGPLNPSAIKEIYPNILPQLTIISEKEITTPLADSCSTYEREEISSDTHPKDGNNNIYNYVDYLVTHLQAVLDNLVTWKPILDNDRTGNITMTFKLTANTNTASGDLVNIGYDIGERTITLPLRGEEIMLPGLQKQDFDFQKWRDDGETLLEMESRFRDALEWVSCIEGARRELLEKVLEAGNQPQPLSEDYYRCEGQPWSDTMAVFLRGWPSSGVPSTSTSTTQPTPTFTTAVKAGYVPHPAAVKNKYEAYKSKDHGASYGHGHANSGNAGSVNHVDL